MDVYELLVDPEARVDARGAYRYMAIAAWRDAAAKTRNQRRDQRTPQTKPTVTVKRRDSLINWHADMVSDFRCYYDFSPGQTRVKQYGTGREIRYRRTDTGAFVSLAELRADPTIGLLLEREVFVRDESKELAECVERFMVRANRKRYRGDKRGTTLNLQVAASADDAYEKNTGTNFTYTGSTLRSYASTVGESSRWSAGMRFQNVTVPNAATINSSELLLRCDTSFAADVDSDIYASGSEDPVDFAADGTVASRSRTTSYTTATRTHTLYVFESYDFTSPIQEVVDRAGYSSGDALLAIAVGSGRTDVSLQIQSYESDSSKAAKLDIDYTAAPTAPAAPSGLTATANGENQIDLEWTDNSGDEDNFEIDRSPNGTDSWAQIATPAANATTYSDTGLDAGTTYYYRVRATNAGGDSAWSSVASATTDSGWRSRLPLRLAQRLNRRDDNR